MYGIEITYSWGDREDIIHGDFVTKEDAYKEMCIMAAKEAYVQNEEFLETHTCEIYFNAYEKEIDLHYNNDDTWCYYRVVWCYYRAVCKPENEN